MSTPDPPAREWIDPSTGYRVLRISEQANSSTLYFNYPSYTPEGDHFIFTTPETISKINLKTFVVSEIILIDKPFRLLFTGGKSRDAYYELQAVKGNREGKKTVMAVNIDTGVTRTIAEMDSGDIQTINADETLIAAVHTAPSNAPIAKFFGHRDPDTDALVYKANWPDGTAMNPPDAVEYRLNEMIEARIPKTIFVINTRAGERRDIITSTDWLNHLLFSPIDPNLLMYCHEGPWHKVDRLWLIRMDQTEPTKIHHRRMNMEIAGHEWYSHGGKWIWYDLQTPRGEDFWLAGYEIATGKRVQYHLDREWFSVHYHSSPDNTYFIGDGSTEDMVGRAKDGKWLTLLKPQSISDVAGISTANAGDLVSPGYCTSERLVDMSEHDYHKFEPSGRFSPDGKWFFFQASFGGKKHIYAVELEKRV